MNSTWMRWSCSVRSRPSAGINHHNFVVMELWEFIPADDLPWDLQLLLLCMYCSSERLSVMMKVSVAQWYVCIYNTVCIYMWLLFTTSSLITSALATFWIWNPPLRWIATNSLDQPMLALWHVQLIVCTPHCPSVQHRKQKQADWDSDNFRGPVLQPDYNYKFLNQVLCLHGQRTFSDKVRKCFVLKMMQRHHYSKSTIHLKVNRKGIMKNCSITGVRTKTFWSILL